MGADRMFDKCSLDEDLRTIRRLRDQNRKLKGENLALRVELGQRERLAVRLAEKLKALVGPAKASKK